MGYYVVTLHVSHGSHMLLKGKFETSQKLLRPIDPLPSHCSNPFAHSSVFCPFFMAPVSPSWHVFFELGALFTCLSGSHASLLLASASIRLRLPIRILLQMWCVLLIAC